MPSDQALSLILALAVLLLLQINLSDLVFSIQDILVFWEVYWRVYSGRVSTYILACIHIYLYN